MGRNEQAFKSHTPLLNVKQCLRQEPVQLPAKAFPWGSISLGLFSSPGLGESILTKILQMLCMIWPQPSGDMEFTVRHFQRGPKISQKHRKFHENDRVQLMCLRFSNIQQYIQSRCSWISRCEALRKITSSSNSNQANFQEETNLIPGEIQM